MSEAEQRILVIEQSIRQSKSEMQISALIGLALCEIAGQLARMTSIVQEDSRQKADLDRVLDLPQTKTGGKAK